MNFLRGSAVTRPGLFSDAYPNPTSRQTKEKCFPYQHFSDASSGPPHTFERFAEPHADKTNGSTVSRLVDLGNTGCMRVRTRDRIGHRRSGEELRR